MESQEKESYLLSQEELGTPEQKAMLKRVEASPYSLDAICGFALEKLSKYSHLDGSPLGLPNLKEFKGQQLNEIDKAELLKAVILIQTKLFPGQLEKQDALLGDQTLIRFEAKIRQRTLQEQVDPSVQVPFPENLPESYASFSGDCVFLMDSIMKVIARNAPNKLGDNGYSTQKLVNMALKNLNSWKGKTIVLGGQGNHFTAAGGAEKAFQATKTLVEAASAYGIKVVVNLRVPYDSNAFKASPAKYAQLEKERVTYAQFVKNEGYTCFDQAALWKTPPKCPAGNVHPAGYGSNSYYAKTSQYLYKFLEEQKTQVPSQSHLA